ncbi:hypothetical protein D3C76_886480 [compost metagenome]
MASHPLPHASRSGEGPAAQYSSRTDSRCSNHFVPRTAVQPPSCPRIPRYDWNRLPDLAQADWQGQFPSPINGTVPQQMTILIILTCSRVQSVPPPGASRADNHITDQDTPCSKNRWQINQSPPGFRPCCYLAPVIGPAGMSAKCNMTYIGDNL